MSNFLSSYFGARITPVAGFFDQADTNQAGLQQGMFRGLRFKIQRIVIIMKKWLISCFVFVDTKRQFSHGAAQNILQFSAI